MFNDWKQAWQQAVANFQRELSEGASGTAPGVRAMEREIVSARGALGKLDDEIRRTAKEADSEQDAVAVCRRREELARNAGDDETVRIAAEFAVRHAERAAVLARKLTVLQDERALLARDVDEMTRLIATAQPAADVGSGRPSSDLGHGSDPDAADAAQRRAFSDLERGARERAAAERLEELKRRMQN
jgi:hypothetical protein